MLTLRDPMLGDRGPGEGDRLCLSDDGEAVQSVSPSRTWTWVLGLRPSHTSSAAAGTCARRPSWSSIPACCRESLSSCEANSLSRASRRSSKWRASQVTASCSGQAGCSWSSELGSGGCFGARSGQGPERGVAASCAVSGGGAARPRARPRSVGLAVGLSMVTGEEFGAGHESVLLREVVLGVVPGGPKGSGWGMSSAGGRAPRGAVGETRGLLARWCGLASTVELRAPSRERAKWWKGTS
mmetsp:Transcript_97985/g.211201  ORF Transcript_97985/g.211201 Transcript_97985/m.211201 type:complete len:241 (-) Transcript_97985:15-737(-)